MKTRIALVALGLLLSCLSAPLMAKTITFGPNQGQRIPTENDLEEQRIAAVVKSIEDVTAQVAQLNALQANTNEQVKQLLQTELANYDQLTRIAAQLEGGAPAKAAAAPVAQTAAAGDGQRAVLMELSRVLAEQSETTKLLVTVMNRMVEEQRTTNSLLQSLPR